jgi:hypothetical protein
MLVVDDSANAAPLQSRLTTELARVVDDALKLEGETWWRFGVITGDPNDGARLRSGCGISGGNPWIDFLPGVLDSVGPGETIGQAVGCLATAGIDGSANQQPMTLAAHALTDDIVENRGFVRPEGLRVVVFILGAAYAESGDVLEKATPIDPNDLVVESVSPPSPYLDPVVQALVNHEQLPETATDWSRLFYWPLEICDCVPAGCLYAPPRDPDHPDFVVEDVTTLPAGAQTLTEIEPCTSTSWQPDCWELLTNSQQCLQFSNNGFQVRVRRGPLGAPANTVTRVSYDCSTN